MKDRRAAEEESMVASGMAPVHWASQGLAGSSGKYGNPPATGEKCCLNMASSTTSLPGIRLQQQQMLNQSMPKVPTFVSKQSQKPQTSFPANPAKPYSVVMLSIGILHKWFSLRGRR